MRRVSVGERLPNVTLARAQGEGVEIVRLERHVQGRRIVLVGLPGAFTPICTQHHIPQLVENADALKASGFDEIICIAPNSPWVVREWAKRTDPQRRLTFLSDGNLELIRAAGLTAQAPQLFLGECSARFTMILKHAVIERLAVEAEIDALQCTKPSEFL